MIRCNQLKMKPGYQMQDIIKKLADKLSVMPEDIRSVEILKESLDARKKPDIFYILSVGFTAKNEPFILKKHKNNKDVMAYEQKKLRFPKFSENSERKRPVVVGAGPAGLFCAYYLAKTGLKPILLERGNPVEQRKKDVEAFWETGVLNKESNVQFGEGGAGTFSDGKLNTLNKDPFGYQKEILSLFVEMGANPSVIYEQKPHLGTDQLFYIVKNIRKAIEKMGGDVRFNAKVTDFCLDENNIVCSVTVNDKEVIPVDHLILAIGHSARDTFEMIYEKKITMEAKSFAVGYRVQHLQKDMDVSQYGIQKPGTFPPATYKLTAKASDGRGVYSFCMCPGGYVVNSSSEEEMLCINGMSYSDRGGINANSAIIVSVNPEDYNCDHPLGGMYFQRSIEKKAYHAGKGSIPVQRLGDFKEKIPSTACGSISPSIKGHYVYTNLRGILDESLEQGFLEGMEQFGHKICGFDAEDVLLAGIEARTSSPVRITRDEACEAVGHKGLYPCGEGAGYAGGITSAAMDGLRVALAVMKNLGGEIL